MKTKKTLLAVLSLSMLACLSVGATAVAASADETAITLDSFTMEVGASVRTAAPNGIRFKSYISDTDYAKLADKNATFGTLVIPRSQLSAGVQNITKETESVLDIPCEKWYNESYNDGRLYTGVLLGTDGANYESKYYNESIVAQAYVTYTENGETKTAYAKAPQERSIAYVASAALANGNDREILSTIVNAAAPATIDITDITQMEIGTSVTPTLVDCGLVAKYTSSNSSVVEVVNGKLVAKAVGSAEITATLGNRTTTETISVVRPSKWNTTVGVTGDTEVYNSGRYTYETAEVGGRNVQKLTINSMSADNFFQNGLILGAVNGNTDSTALEYNKVVFDLYASDNAKVEMGLGYYYKGAYAGDKTNGAMYKVGFAENMSAEDRACVRFYNMDGEEIYFTTGEWIRVEFSLDDYKERTAEEYFRVMIGSAVAGSSIAVDNAYFDMAELAESTLGEKTTLSTTVSITGDTELYNSGRYTYETAEIDGRNVQKLTINSMSADNFYQNGLIFGNVGGNTDSAVLDEYNKVAFDLYASHNSNVEITLGYYYKGASAGDKTNGGMYKVRFSGILSAEDQARVRFYNMDGEEIRYTTGEWIRVEFSLDDYKARTAEEYFRIMIGSAVVGSSIAVDNAHFDKATLAASTLTSGFTENASFRLNCDMSATDYTYEAVEIDGRSAQQLTINTMKPGYEGIQQNGLMFGTRDDNNTDEKYLAYEKLVLELYVAEGSDVKLSWGYYYTGENRTNGGFHAVTITESLSTEDQARVRFYNMQGEATEFKTGEWLRVEFSLADYKARTGQEYFRTLIGTTKNGSSFAIGRCYFSSDAF